MTAAIHDLDVRRLRDPGDLPANLGEVGFFRRPHLPRGVRYALLWSRPAGHAAAHKPFVYASAAELARALHRRRAGAPIQLADVAILVEPRRCPDAPTPGVSVWAMDPHTGARDRFLGWAYADGGGRHQLQFALRLNPIGWD